MSNKNITTVYTVFFTMALATLASSLAAWDKLLLSHPEIILFVAFFILARTKFFLDDLKQAQGNPANGGGKNKSEDTQSNKSRSIEGWQCDCNKKWHFLFTIAAWFCWIMAAKISDQHSIMLNCIWLVGAICISCVVLVLDLVARRYTLSRAVIFFVFNLLYIVFLLIMALKCHSDGVTLWCSAILLGITIVDLSISKSYLIMYGDNHTP